MPSIKFEMPEELMRGLKEVSTEIDEIMSETLTAGAEVIEKKVRSNLSNAIGKNANVKSRSSGQLLGALGISPCKKRGADRYDINVGFNEPREDGKSNAMIANVLEYGKKGQAPKPFMKPAERATREAATEAAQSKFVEVVEGKLKNGG